ncbi:DUF86 domain-containing protein [candidate division KSB1 bacterium]|nr:DUF86 domain-containing protein [candidate division KSB1 bacterium]
MVRNPKLYLNDILSSIDKIFEFIQGFDFEDFVDDDKTSSAVIRKLEIIGEAVKNVPDEIKNQYPDIKWREIARMRDKLIHWYFGTDYDIVWKVLKDD